MAVSSRAHAGPRQAEETAAQRGLARSLSSRPLLPAITQDLATTPWSPRMGKAEGAGRPPRIASPPARSGRSGPPGSTTKDASTPPEPSQAQLRDSEVAELERELTD